jgi:cytochrome c oxidase subunit 2
MYGHQQQLLCMFIVHNSLLFRRIIQNQQIRWFVLEGQIIETIWTIAPAVILVFIVVPSIRVLCWIDEIHNPVLTLKAVGHQWYWSYEYSDFTKLEFVSYIVQKEDQQTNIFQLIDTDNQIVLPINSLIGIIVIIGLCSRFQHEGKHL